MGLFLKVISYFSWMTWNVIALAYLISRFLAMTTQTREFPIMSMKTSIENNVTMATWADSESANKVIT